MATRKQQMRINTDAVELWIQYILDMGLEIRINYGDDDTPDRITQTSVWSNESLMSDLYAADTCWIEIWDDAVYVGNVLYIAENMEDAISDYSWPRAIEGLYTDVFSSIDRMLIDVIGG